MAVRQGSVSVKDLDRAILRLVAEHEGPVGQGTLNLSLRRQGFALSTPTVGRKLQVLQFEGLLRKVGVDGRVITERGLNALHEWDAEAKLRGSGEALLVALQRGDKKHILDLLMARRVIEGETAALAARYASTKSIRRMDEILERQRAGIAAGGLGIEEDVRFHETIAEVSDNAVLHSLVSLLRQHRRYNFLITSMRTVVGTQLVVEHAAILEAIKARAPARAREAMQEHLGRLTDDISSYWRRWMRSASAK
jgi:GntR family L-lactate dehydrogenase operon transcriptional regulator